MKEVAKVLKKHNLPKIEDFKKEIDISDIEDKSDPLRFLSDKLGGKIEHFSVILDTLIQPDSSFSNIHEYSAFSEAEKKSLMNTYKKLMYLHRRYLEVTLVGSESNSADFIKEFLETWPVLREELAIVLKKMKESWESDAQTLQIELGYLG